MRFTKIGMAALVVFGLATPALAKDYTVKMDKMKFVPASLTVAKGDTIHWVNADSQKQPHNVTAKNKAFKASPLLMTGGKFTWKAVKPGVVPYTCTIHPGMNGTITVK